MVKARLFFVFLENLTGEKIKHYHSQVRDSRVS